MKNNTDLVNELNSSIDNGSTTFRRLIDTTSIINAGALHIVHENPTKSTNMHGGQKQNFLQPISSATSSGKKARGNSATTPRRSQSKGKKTSKTVGKQAGGASTGQQNPLSQSQTLRRKKTRREQY